MIDAKHWSGVVTLTDGQLRQNDRSRAMVLRKTAKAALDVSATLGRGPAPLIPVVCLTKSGSSLAPTYAEGVLIVGLNHLTEALGTAPVLDLELALVMERALGVLSDSRGVAPHIHEALDTPRTVRGRRAVSGNRPTRRQQGSTGSAHQKPSAGASPRRKKKRGPSPLAALLYIALLYLLATNIDVLMSAMSPIIEGVVSLILED